MNISLTPELEDFIDQKVNSGMYTSSSEVVREALRLLIQEEQLQQAKLEAIRGTPKAQSKTKKKRKSNLKNSLSL